MAIPSVFPEIRAKLWQNVLSCNAEESFNKFLNPDEDVDDLISSVFSTDTSAKNRSAVFCEAVNRETDRRQVLPSLRCGGNNYNKS